MDQFDPKQLERKVINSFVHRYDHYRDEITEMYNKMVGEAKNAGRAPHQWKDYNEDIYVLTVPRRVEMAETTDMIRDSLDLTYLSRKTKLWTPFSQYRKLLHDFRAICELEDQFVDRINKLTA